MATQQERKAKIPSPWRHWTVIVTAVVTVLATAVSFVGGWQHVSKTIWVAFGAFAIILAYIFTYFQYKDKE